MILKRRNVEIEEFDEDKIRSLKSEGFEVLTKTVKEEIKESETVNLQELTVKELKIYAKDKGLKISNTLKKDEIIEILEDLENEGESETETTE